VGSNPTPSATSLECESLSYRFSSSAAVCSPSVSPFANIGTTLRPERSVPSSEFQGDDQAGCVCEPNALVVSAHAIPPHADCSPMRGSTAAEPSCAHCKQCARSAMRMTIGRHCKRRPLHDLHLGEAGFTSDFHSITDV
jgi:hypothetical protein